MLFQVQVLPSHNPSAAAITELSSPSFLVKNFNTLYDLSDVVHLTAAAPSSSSDDNIVTTAAAPTDEQPDFSAVLASKRFFISSPGESNSIVESLPTSPITKSGGGVAIQTYSPDPYADFRRSMQEMLEAHKSKSKSKSSSSSDEHESDLDYLGELLKCYLSLNPQRNHKLIVRAFSDLVVSLCYDLHRGQSLTVEARSLSSSKAPNPSISASPNLPSLRDRRS